MRYVNCCTKNDIADSKYAAKFAIRRNLPTTKRRRHCNNSLDIIGRNGSVANAFAPVRVGVSSSCDAIIYTVRDSFRPRVRSALRALGAHAQMNNAWRV